ncbi:hypothetical protein FHW88_001553 [Mucilaginibacter sp. SG538B]|nr:hypothetical protein [Mucilaginibacter sp. SG538B]
MRGGMVHGFSKPIVILGMKSYWDFWALINNYD